jgi:hypothetical protein
MSIWKAINSRSPFLFLESRQDPKIQEPWEWFTSIVKLLPSWKGVPLWAESHRCSSYSQGVESELHSNQSKYLIIPVRNTRIVTSGLVTLNVSFKAFFESIDIYSIREFDWMCNTCFEIIYGNDKQPDARELKRVKEALQKLKESQNKQLILSHPDINTTVSAFIEKFTEFQNDPVAYLSHELSPEKNGFRIQEAQESLVIRGNHEAWFQSPALAIRADVAPKFFESVRL